eukprot:m.431125 g.431125  ORF g.431125 m.431125 type:complete len:67 (+) comp82533_c0_seq1:151-351(+)
MENARASDSPAKPPNKQGGGQRASGMFELRRKAGFVVPAEGPAESARVETSIWVPDDNLSGWLDSC